MHVLSSLNHFLISYHMFKRKKNIIVRSKHLQKIQTIQFFQHRNLRRATAVAPEARVAPGDAVAIAQDRAEGVAGGAQLLDVVQLLLSHGERNIHIYIYIYILYMEYIW